MPQNFRPTRFGGLTLEQQMAKCREMAAEAKAIVATCAADGSQYLELTAKWSDLAAEMEATLREAKD